MGFNIAIDGPAGAGKSTIAKLVAKEKGYIYVDTGAMYRAMSVFFMEKSIKPSELELIAKHCEEAEVTINYENGLQQVYLNNRNITSELRKEEVGNLASQYAGIDVVRKQLLDLQLELARTKDVVMDGRDIGTNVLKSANVKIYLTASVAARAKRRYKELTENGILANVVEIEKDIIDRDTRDMNREIAPLKQAEDAVLIDSSHMTIDMVVNTILKACE